MTTGDIFRRVTSGEPVAPSALQWNAFIDAAEAHRRGQKPGKNQGWQKPDGQVFVKNTSGNNVDRFGIIGIGDVVFSPTDNLTEFLFNFGFVGEQVSSSHAGKFGVYQEPVTDGEYGVAMVQGLTPCNVNITDAAHEYADVADNDPTQLESAETGAARILYKEAATGSSTRCIVCLSNPAGAAGGANEPEPEAGCDCKDCQDDTNDTTECPQCDPAPATYQFVIDDTLFTLNHVPANPPLTLTSCEWETGETHDYAGEDVIWSLDLSSGREPGQVVLTHGNVSFTNVRRWNSHCSNEMKLNDAHLIDEPEREAVPCTICSGYTPPGPAVAVAVGNDLYLLDLATGQEIWSVTVGYPVGDVGFLADGDLLTSGLNTAELKVLSRANGSEVQSLRGPGAVGSLYRMMVGPYERAQSPQQWVESNYAAVGGSDFLSYSNFDFSLFVSHDDTTVNLPNFDYWGRGVSDDQGELIGGYLTELANVGVAKVERDLDGTGDSVVLWHYEAGFPGGPHGVFDTAVTVDGSWVFVGHSVNGVIILNGGSGAGSKIFIGRPVYRLSATGNSHCYANNNLPAGGASAASTIKLDNNGTPQWTFDGWNTPAGLLGYPLSTDEESGDCVTSHGTHLGGNVSRLATADGVPAWTSQVGPVDSVPTAVSVSPPATA